MSDVDALRQALRDAGFGDDIVAAADRVCTGAVGVSEIRAIRLHDLLADLGVVNGR